MRAERTGRLSGVGEHIQRFRGRLGAWRVNPVDAALATLLGLGVLAVHDVRYMLDSPFWLDETWVAVSTRMPLGQLPLVTSSTPIGWTLLLRVFAWGHGQDMRLLPLLFSSLTVAAAYYLGRGIAWGKAWFGRVAGVLAAAAALLNPSALARDDLKQYTSEAFFAVVILVATSRLERSWSRRNLVALGLTVFLGFLFSDASLFVGVCALGALVLVTGVRRQWANFREVLVAAALTGAGLVLIYLVFYRPNVAPNLTAYWAANYVPTDSIASAAKFIWTGAKVTATRMGLASFWLAAALVGLGVATFARLGRPAVAIALPALLVCMVAAGTLKLYPLFDLRTSHFVVSTLTVTAAVGVAGICSLGRRLHAVIPYVLAAAAIAGYVVHLGFIVPAEGVLRGHPLPREDTRTPTAYIAAHVKVGDVVVVDSGASWGFAYYWPGDQRLVAQRSSDVATQFLPSYPDDPDIIISSDSNPAAPMRSMTTATERSTTGRIWVIYQHLRPQGLKDYEAFGPAHQLVVTNISASGSTGLMLFQPRG